MKLDFWLEVILGLPLSYLSQSDIVTRTKDALKSQVFRGLYPKPKIVGLSTTGWVLCAKPENPARNGCTVYTGSYNSANFSIVRIYKFLCSSDSAWGPLNSEDTKYHIAIYKTVITLLADKSTFEFLVILDPLLYKWITKTS